MAAVAVETVGKRGSERDGARRVSWCASRRVTSTRLPSSANPRAINVPCSPFLIVVLLGRNSESHEFLVIVLTALCHTSPIKGPLYRDPSLSIPLRLGFPVLARGMDRCATQSPRNIGPSGNASPRLRRPVARFAGGRGPRQGCSAPRARAWRSWSVRSRDDVRWSIYRDRDGVARWKCLAQRLVEQPIDMGRLGFTQKAAFPVLLGGLCAATKPPFRGIVTTPTADGERLSSRMLARRDRPDGFIDPCIPTLAAKPSAAAGWVHEIKHDGYRLIGAPRRRHRATVHPPRPRLDRSTTVLCSRAPGTRCGCC